MNNRFVELITYPIKVRNAFKCTTPQAVLMCIYLFHTYTVYCFSKTHSGIYMSFYPSWMHHDDIIKWKHFPHYWPFVTGEFPSQRPVTWSFDDFFDLCLNKQLNKQLRHWWFEMPSCPLWRHCNALVMSLVSDGQINQELRSFLGWCHDYITQ